MEDVYTLDNISAFCSARDEGGIVEVNQELWWYFLEVLPPIHMRYIATVPSAAKGETVRIAASFGFAEGAEFVTAFWRGTGLSQGRYFAQKTIEMNPCR